MKQGARCGFGYLPMARRWNAASARPWRRAATATSGCTPATSAATSRSRSSSPPPGPVRHDRLPRPLPRVRQQAITSKKEPGVFTSTPRDVFTQALDISAYSLIALTRAALPHDARSGGSVIALTYLGSEKVIPGYNVMGVAKAALEVDRPLPRLRPRRPKDPREHDLRRPGEDAQRHGGGGHRRDVRPHRSARPRSTATSTATRSARPPSTC